MRYCCQPLHSCEQSHGGGIMKKKSPVICCVTLHPHASVVQAVHPRSLLARLQPLARAVWSRLLWMGPFPVWAQVM